MVLDDNLIACFWTLHPTVWMPLKRKVYNLASTDESKIWQTPIFFFFPYLWSSHLIITQPGGFSPHIAPHLNKSNWFNYFGSTSEQINLIKFFGAESENKLIWFFLLNSEETYEKIDSKLSIPCRQHRHSLLLSKIVIQQEVKILLLQNEKLPKITKKLPWTKI